MTLISRLDLDGHVSPFASRHRIDLWEPSRSDVDAKIHVFIGLRLSIFLNEIQCYYETHAIVDTA